MGLSLFLTFSNTITVTCLSLLETVVGILKYLMSDITQNQLIISSIIYLDPSTNPIVNAQRSITNTLTSYATVICGVLYMIEFLKMTIKVEGVKYEYILSIGFKFVLARAALSIGSQVLLAITATANDLASNTLDIGSISISAQPFHDWYFVTVTDQNFEDALNEMIKAVENTKGKTMDLILTTIVMLIPLCASKIILFIGVIMAYGRMFEMSMYQIMYPLPCGLMLMDHGRIPKRFFASYFACALQGPIMILSVQIFKGMVITSMAEITQAGGDSMYPLAFSLLMGSLFMLMGMLRSGTWANRIIGEG